jgi:rhamnulokinase
MPAAIRDYCARTGQAAPAGPGEFARCIYESLAATYARVLGNLERVTGERIEVIHIVGGGSRSALLCQLTADAARRPVVAGPAEATVIGNLMVQALSLGLIESHAAGRELVRRSFPARAFEPR